MFLTPLLRLIDTLLLNIYFIEMILGLRKSPLASQPFSEEAKLAKVSYSEAVLYKFGGLSLCR